MSTGFRLVLAVVAWTTLCLPSKSKAGPFDHYMTGSVSISSRPAADPNRRSAGLFDVQSAGGVTIQDWKGDIDWGARIDGLHWIHPSGDTGFMMAFNEIGIWGQYASGGVRTEAEQGSCYRARITAFSSNTNADPIEQGSNEECPYSNCPLILDLDHRGLQLTGPDSGVRFDIDADGDLDLLGWTYPWSGDGFLCMDRNDNGRIDDGSELFGTATRLSGGGLAANGYVALGDLDRRENGGDANGRINNGDRDFDQLCIWFDRNHDGISQAGELVNAANWGILELSHEYRWSLRQDQFGNQFRLRSHGFVDSANSPGRFVSYDVFFKVAPEH